MSNHAKAIIACDFFVAVSATFRSLYVFVLVHHGSRQLLHINVTAHPTSADTAGQWHRVHARPEVSGSGSGGNAHTNATRLREPMAFKPGYIRPVAPEVTDANFRYWLMMRLQCSDEQMTQLDFDHFAEVWSSCAYC